MVEVVQHEVHHEVHPWQVLYQVELSDLCQLAEEALVLSDLLLGAEEGHLEDHLKVVQGDLLDQVKEAQEGHVWVVQEGRVREEQEVQDHQ